MSRGSSSLGGGGFSGGFSSGRSTGSYGGSHSSHSSGSGLLSGLIIGSLLSRRSGGSSGSSSGGGQSSNPMYKRVRNQKATLITCAIMLAIAITFIVLAVVFRFDAVYAQTGGVATDYDRKFGYYYTTYEFTVDGNEYSVESKVGWTKLENMEGKAYTPENIDTYYLHKTYQIFYKKADPYTIYEIEARSDMPSTNALYIFLAVFFGFVTIVTYAVGVYKLEIDPAYVEEQKRQEEAKQMEGKRKCPYCGTIMDAKETKCPNCGSSTK